MISAILPGMEKLMDALQLLGGQFERKNIIAGGSGPAAWGAAQVAADHEFSTRENLALPM